MCDLKNSKEHRLVSLLGQSQSRKTKTFSNFWHVMMARIYSPVLICYNDAQLTAQSLCRRDDIVTTAGKHLSAYLEMSQFHLLRTAFIWALYHQRQNLSLCEIVRKQLIFQQYFIVNWALVTCIPKRSRNSRVSKDWLQLSLWNNTWLYAQQHQNDSVFGV